MIANRRTSTLTTRTAPPDQRPSPEHTAAIQATERRRRTRIPACKKRSHWRWSNVTVQLTDNSHRSCQMFTTFWSCILTLEHQPALRDSMAMQVAQSSIWTTRTAPIRLANRRSSARNFRHTCEKERSNWWIQPSKMTRETSCSPSRTTSTDEPENPKIVTATSQRDRRVLCLLTSFKFDALEQLKYLVSHVYSNRNDYLFFTFENEDQRWSVAAADCLAPS